MGIPLFVHSLKKSGSFENETIASIVSLSLGFTAALQTVAKVRKRLPCRTQSIRMHIQVALPTLPYATCLHELNLCTCSNERAVHGNSRAFL